MKTNNNQWQTMKISARPYTSMIFYEHQYTTDRTYIQMSAHLWAFINIHCDPRRSLNYYKQILAFLNNPTPWTSIINYGNE